jgi:hypothetical protein
VENLSINHSDKNIAINLFKKSYLIEVTEMKLILVTEKEIT